MAKLEQSTADEKRALLDAAEARVSILAHGLAYALDHLDDIRWSSAEARAIIGMVGSDFVPAVQAAEKAAREYEPFTPRGRRRMVRAFSRKNPPKKKVAA